MGKLFYTSDTHFGDSVVLKYCKSRQLFTSVEEMDYIMIENWNSVVSPNDTVYHLGDFSHKTNSIENIKKYKNKLNGEIRLLRGNHDIQNGLEKLFEITEQPFENVFWCCHYPLQRNLKYYTLTGHIHEKWRIQRRMLNVGVDVNNFIPLSHEEIEECEKIEDNGYWDANVYPDAPKDWKLKVSTIIDRGSNDPTLALINKEN